MSIVSAIIMAAAAFAIGWRLGRKQGRREGFWYRGYLAASEARPIAGRAEWQRMSQEQRAAAGGN